LQIDSDHWKKNKYPVQIRESYPRTNRVDFKNTGNIKNTDSNIQIKWGEYTFNCKESIVDNRKVCDCGGKYLKKSDLRKINKKGFEFIVNGSRQAFEEVSVYTHGHVYCKKEDLMISSDL